MTKKLSTPFAVNSTLRNDVPVKATTEQTAKGIIGYADGWTSINKLPIDNGGQAPWMEDINGVLHDVTGNISDINKGLPQYFDTDFATSIGGYPIGARLCLDDNSEYVVSTIASNSNNPNSNMTGWKKTNFSEYDFKTEQPIQYYYDLLGNWDDAIFQAQMNVYLLGYSPKLILPRGQITLYKPILGGVALGEAIDKYLKDNNIATDFYDSTTGNFKSSWALNLSGVESSVNDVSTIETQIIFKGCADYKDTTWKNYGIIHCAPTTQGQWWGTDSVIKHARNEHYLRNFNILAETRGTWVGGSQVHGIVAQDAHHCIIDNVLVYSLHGAGLLYDNVYDSECRNLTLLRVGRQNGGDLQTIRDTASYKTFGQMLYAPLHLMNTKGDNCNFLRFYNTHIEDCFDVMADVYVGGNSSPIWFKDSHHECEADSGTVVNGNPKTTFAIGTANGIYKIFADGLSDWDVSNPKVGNGGGYVNIEGGSMYNTDYNALIRQGQYSSTVLSNYRYPNTSDIYLDGGNTGSGLKAINSNLGTVSQTASADAVVIGNCTMTGFNHTYGVPPSINNTKCSGNITFNISTGDITNPIVLDNVICNRLIANQTLPNVIGSITTTSTTEVGVSGLVYPSNLLINDSYYNTYLASNT